MRSFYREQNDQKCVYTYMYMNHCFRCQLIIDIIQVKYSISMKTISSDEANLALIKLAFALI